MERKEAIDWLYRLLSSVRTHLFDVPKLWHGSIIEALGIAISSLETDEAYQLEYERTTKKDLAVAAEDCISREWTKTAIHNFFQGLIHRVTEEDIQRYLDVAPSAYPKSEPVHARWEYTDAYPHWVCCPNCKRRFLPNKEWIGLYNIPTNYCPNCGAKMVEPQERSDKG